MATKEELKKLVEHYEKMGKIQKAAKKASEELRESRLKALKLKY